MVFFVGERFGRRRILMAGGTITVLGSIILAASTTVAQLIVGRIVTAIVGFPILIHWLEADRPRATA